MTDRRTGGRERGGGKDRWGTFCGVLYVHHPFWLSQQLFKYLKDEEDETQGVCYLPGEVNIVSLFLCPGSEFLSIILGTAYCLILSNGAGKSPLLSEWKLLGAHLTHFPNLLWDSARNSNKQRHLLQAFSLKVLRAKEVEGSSSSLAVAPLHLCACLSDSICFSISVAPREEQKISAWWWLQGSPYIFFETWFWIVPRSWIFCLGSPALIIIF